MSSSPDLNEYIARLSALESALAALEGLAWDIAETYKGSDFPEQGEWASALENTGIEMTHEAASQIGFCRERFTRLARLIEFRKNYRQFSDAEIGHILDGTLSLKEKSLLAKKCGNVAALLKIMPKMQAHWQQLFGTLSYSRIKREIAPVPGRSPDIAILWSAYADAEAEHLRHETGPALERFIEAMRNANPAETKRWAIGFAEASQKGTETTPVRLPLFREILFPTLLAGYMQDDLDCIRLLGGFCQLLYQSPECLQQFAETERSEYGLLLKHHRLKPDDTVIRARLIDIIADNIEYALHELPLGVLYGHDGASIGECTEMLEELDFFETLLQEGARPDLNELLADARHHIAAYQHYLATRKSDDSFKQYLQTEKAVPVSILRQIDDAFPGWVECELVDAIGKRHLFHEKTPVVSAPSPASTAPSATHPQTGFIACRPVATWAEKPGRWLTRIDTTRPWGIASTDDDSQFTVHSETIIALPE